MIAQLIVQIIMEDEDNETIYPGYKKCSNQKAIGELNSCKNKIKQ